MCTSIELGERCSPHEAPRRRSVLGRRWRPRWKEVFEDRVLALRQVERAPRVMARLRAMRDGERAVLDQRERIARPRRARRTREPAATRARRGFARVVRADGEPCTRFSTASGAVSTRTACPAAPAKATSYQVNPSMPGRPMSRMTEVDARQLQRRVACSAVCTVSDDIALRLPWR